MEQLEERYINAKKDFDEYLKEYRKELNKYQGYSGNSKRGIAHLVKVKEMRNVLVELKAYYEMLEKEVRKVK